MVPQPDSGSASSGIGGGTKNEIRNSPMKCCVITGATSLMKSTLEASLPSKRAYCERHGYDLSAVDFNSTDHLGFRRFEIALAGLGFYDSVFWIDADSMITNHEIPFPSMLSGQSPMAASWDWWSNGTYFSTGNFILSRHEMLSTLSGLYLSEKSRRLDDPNQEQNTLNEVWKSRPELVQILPHEMLNSVPEMVRNDISWNGRDAIIRPWQPGDFLAHLTGCGNDQRVRIMAALAGLGLKA